MKATVLLLPLCLLPALPVEAEATRWPEYTVSEFSGFRDYFNQLIPGFERGVDASKAGEAYRHFGFAAFPELTPFLSHESHRVRRHAMAHLWTFVRSEPDAAKCQRMLGRLIECLADDPERANRQWLERRLPGFPAGYFDEAAKTRLKDLLAEENHHEVRSGYLVLTASIALPEGIEEVLAQNRRRFPMFVAMAMARLGHADDLQSVLDRESAQNVMRLASPTGALFPAPADEPLDRNYLMALAYTKQPAAIQKLVDYAFDERMSPSGHDHGPSYTAGWAIEVLSMIFKDFPLTDEASAHSPDKIASARNWLKTRYSASDPLALLDGREVQGWR